MKNFCNQMQEILGNEDTHFIEAISLPTVKAIRVNTHKILNAEFLSISPFLMTSIALFENGFIVKDDTKVGLHAYSHAGLYYPQEPSEIAAIGLTLQCYTPLV